MKMERRSSGKRTGARRPYANPTEDLAIANVMREERKKTRSEGGRHRELYSGTAPGKGGGR